MSQPENSSTLNPRQIDVVRLVAAGLDNHQIAKTLVIALPTVKRHVANIVYKTGVTNRAELTTYAIEHGLLDSDDDFPSRN